MQYFIEFGSIGDFSKISKSIAHESKNQNNISLSYPVLDAIGAEKIHGTNFSVCYNLHDGIWFQKKTEIINLKMDNAGSAFFGLTHSDILIKLIKSLATEYKIDLNTNSIALFGEWAGNGVISKSAVSGLDKQFYLFQHFKVSPINEEKRLKETYWEETKVNNVWIESKEDKIYNLMNFKTYKLTIDFNNPSLYQNKMIELVNELEKNSPVGQELGINNNIGEGIVFTVKFKNHVLKWKVKGTKHSNSHVKTLKQVDNVKEQLKIDIAAKVTPAWRLEQMFEEANDCMNGGIASVKNMSVFLRKVIADVIKEDIDLLVDNNLELKDVDSKIAKISRNWYLEQINEN